MEFLNKKQKIILLAILAIMLFVICYYIMNKTDKYDYEEIEEMENQTENVLDIKENNIEIKEKELEENKYIILHITGAVFNEGIVEVEQGARISDVIQAAGGTTENADLSKVNLAYKVEDGQKIYIPNINDEKNIETEYIKEDSGENVIIEPKEKENDNQIVNINTASQTELETLSGIGPSTALKIINYRRENGEFKAIEDIKNVQGIGDAKFEAIKEQISVE